MKLNFGCGHLKFKGYLNCDKSKLVNPDKIVDLEKKLPFRTNSVDEIRIYAACEHITNFIQLVKEMHRVCKKGAKIYVRVPFYSAWGHYNDPTHVRFFGLHTFDYFNKSIYSHEVGCNKDMFKIKFRLNFAIGKAKCLNFIMNPLVNIFPNFYSRFFAWIIPCSEIQYKLEVVK